MYPQWVNGIELQLFGKALWTSESERKCMHGYGKKIALYYVFAAIENDMEMPKGVMSENDIVAANGCEYSCVKFI